MGTKRIIRLSLISSLLVIVNGCGDGSSNNQEAKNQDDREDDKKSLHITLKGDSQVDIIQGSSFRDLGATAVGYDGKALKIT